MKKILAFIVSLLLVFTLVGCGNDYDFKSRFDLVFADVNVAAVENNIQLPTKAGNLMFEWESSNPDVISNDGIVKRAKEDVKVTLKAVMTYQGQTEELSIEVTVKGIGEVALAKNTIKEACEGATGEYEVSGTVVAFNAQSFLIQDETGVIMSFHGNGFTKDVKVGDVVLLTGTTTVYGASTQFKNATYSIVASEEVKHSAQKEYTAAELDALCEANADDKSATFKPEYVKVKGVVEISGNFFNVKIDGAAKAVGSLVYPVNTDEYTALNGKEIEVNAYLTGVTGPGKYLQLMVVDYTVLGDGGGDDTPVDPSVKTIAEIVAGDNGSYIAEGTVVGTNAQSFLIQDETGIIMVYCGKSYAKDLVIGDKVKISGSTTEYGKAKQFAAGSTYEKTGKGTVNRGEAVALTVAELDAYATMEAIAPKFVKVTGEVAVSGSYFNLNIEGTSSVVGSLVYPVDADALTALNGKELEVYAYLTGLTGTKYLQLVVVEYKEVEGTGTVDPVDPAEKTIGEIIASENGEYITTGLVVGVNAQSFLIKDETGIMLVYNGSSWTKDVEVGDKVKVSGSTTEYGKAKQFGFGSKYEKVGTETVDHGAAKELSAADCDAYASEKTVKPEYVKVKGVLTVSGNYYNVAIEGATITGSISYPINADEVKALAGKEIEIVGYVTGTSGSDKYLNVLALEVKATDGTTPTPTPTPTPNPGPVTAEGVKFDFVSNFDVYGGSWESSYSEKVLSNSDLGVDTKAQFVLSNANRQAQTIMDRPVLASKSSATQYVTVSGWEGTLTQVTFELKQWSGSKKFTKLVLEYTTDGSTWTAASADLASAGATVLEATQMIQTTTLPENATAVRFAFLGSSTSNNQIGLTAIYLKFAE